MKKLLYSHRIPEHVEPISVSLYIYNITDIYPSRKSIYKAIKKGDITVNDKIREPGKWIYPGDLIQIYEHESEIISSYSIKLNVLYEDEWMAVVEKPAGLITNRYGHKTLEMALPVNLKQSSLHDALNFSRPVHRLDKSTGGLVIIGKTSSALISLSSQFEKRAIQKKYRAIVSGKLDGNGEINDPIDNKDAITRYSVLKQVPSLQNVYMTLIDCWPLTGRYHQIRRHLSGHGFPIVGDKKYNLGSTLQGKGLFLWSIEIVCFNDYAQKEIHILINEPRKFHSLLQREEKRWNKFQSIISDEPELPE